MNRRHVLALFLAAPGLAWAHQSATPPAQSSLKTLVNDITESRSGNEGRTRLLVDWVNTKLQWSATDYRRRTPEEVIERRQGNCAELASVLAVMLKEAGIPYRWAAEINIQPRNEGRQESAAQKVASLGKRASVFGLMHNDHVWLEVQDERDGTWFPADPAAGVVGYADWVATRMAFANRTVPRIPDTAAIVAEMLTPFLVLSMETRNSKPTEIRSQRYVIDAFNAYYGGRLERLPSWAAWREKIAALAVLGHGAFIGQVNLHQHQREIEAVWQLYNKLRQEARQAGL